MKRLTLCALTAVLFAALPLVAAEGQRGRSRAQREPRPVGVEQLLRARERLELTEAQIVRLQEFRREDVGRRQANSNEMLELRSRLEVGDATREEMREWMDGRREALQSQRDQQQERVNALLTEDQRQRINTLRSQRGRAGRGMQRGGTRGGRSAARGSRGRGSDRRSFRGQRGRGRSDVRGRARLDRRGRRPIP